MYVKRESHVAVHYLHNVIELSGGKDLLNKYFFQIQSTFIQEHYFRYSLVIKRKSLAIESPQYRKKMDFSIPIFHLKE